jgi:hypothetical protein
LQDQRVNKYNIETLNSSKELHSESSTDLINKLRTTVPKKLQAVMQNSGTHFNVVSDDSDDNKAIFLRPKRDVKGPQDFKLTAKRRKAPLK